jgi:hypothetical protein
MSSKKLENLVILDKTIILTIAYRSQLTIFSIDNQHEKGSKKNAMGGGQRLRIFQLRISI